MKLEVKDASIGYKKQVLSSNINMASEPGMVTAILGQNGCGKTTFVKSLMKLIPWCGGGAFLDGVDMRNIKDRQLWRKMDLIFGICASKIDKRTIFCVRYGAYWPQSIQITFCAAR